MTSRMIAVLNPTVKRRVSEVAVAQRLPDLNDKAIAFLWNSKVNGDLLLLRVKELLLQKFRLAGTSWHQKATAALPAEATLLEALGQDDLVINGVGD